MSTSGQQAPTLDAVLASAGAYVARFAGEVSGVVIEEDYVQQVRVRMITTRHLRSDVMVVADTDQGLVEFRDVFEVDGKPVRDRDDRLAHLFAAGRPDQMKQARRIADEGARFNLNAEGTRLTRTLNLPMAALAFLRTNNQRRSAFRFDGYSTMQDRRVRVVQFTETAQPRLIGSGTGDPAMGTFWIDPETGVVAATELRLTSSSVGSSVTAVLHVTYAPDAAITSWMPRTMEEHYDVRAGNVNSASIDGTAKYSNVRHFNVAVEERAAP